MAAAPVVARLLASCQRLKLLVTSRVRLHLRGEREFPVPPLALPDPELLRRPRARSDPAALQALSQYAAVALFIERAGEIRPEFTVTNENAPAIAEICHRLDGLPLAIELAAARSRLLPPSAILARLQSRLRFLTGGARDLPARQQTLRDAIAWSYDLLTPAERALFRRLAVFVGGWTLDAAERVMGDGCWVMGDEGAMSPPITQHPSPITLDVFEGIASLVDKSLVRELGEVAGEPRFGMLETIREFGLEQLEACGEAAAVRRRHAEHFLALAEAAGPHLTTDARAVWQRRLEVEHDNLRAALAWCGAEPSAIATGLRLANAMRWFWWLAGHWREGRGWLEEALARARPLAERDAAVRALFPPALHVLGLMALQHGDYPAAQRLLEEAVAGAEAEGDLETLAYSVHCLGLSRLGQSEYAAARAHLERGLGLFHRLGIRWMIAQASLSLGDVARCEGDVARAESLYRTSREIFDEVGQRTGVASALQNLGYLAACQGRLAEAGASLTAALEIFHEASDRRGVAECLAGLAGVSLAQGPEDARPAVVLLGAADAQLRALGAVISPSNRPDYERTVTAARAQLGEAAFGEAWSSGAAMSLEEALTPARRVAASM